MASQIFHLTDDLAATPAKRDAFEQGADFGWVVKFYAADVADTDETDWLARMQVRRAPADADSGAPLIDIDSGPLGGIALVVSSDDDGDFVECSVAVPAAVTEAMPVGRWHYDLELVRLADGHVRRLTKGRAQVTGEVTREVVA